MSTEVEGDEPRREEAEAGGLIGATREPLWQALSAGLSTAATILAIVFLASGAVRLEAGSAVFGLALAGFAVAAALAPVWLGAGRLHRTRTTAIAVSLALAAVVAVRGIMSLIPFATRSAPEGAPDVLLVTVDGDESSSGASPAGDRWRVAESVPSARRFDPALASVLTGLETIEHRVLYRGDELPEHAPTIGEILGSSGWETALFGSLGLPAWAGRRLDLVSETRSLDEALAWLGSGRGAPRFAHVHAGPADAAGIAAGVDSHVESGGVAIIAAPTGEAIWWGRRAGRSIGSGPRSSTSIVPSILEVANVVAPHGQADAPTLFDTAPGFVAVTFDHGLTNAVHGLRATFADGALEIELTPLGRHPTDDWSLDETLQSHFVYRNEIEIVETEGGGARPTRPSREKRERVRDWMERIRAWRRRNGSFEAATAH